MVEGVFQKPPQLNLHSSFEKIVFILGYTIAILDKYQVHILVRYWQQGKQLGQPQKLTKGDKLLCTTPFLFASLISS